MRAKRRAKNSPAQILFIVVIALLAALVMLGRILKPLRRPSSSRAAWRVNSQIAASLADVGSSRVAVAEASRGL
jgi:hypothetical protein